jgi:hypothetical protein
MLQQCVYLVLIYFSAGLLISRSFSLTNSLGLELRTEDERTGVEISRE